MMLLSTGKGESAELPATSMAAGYEQNNARAGEPECHDRVELPEHGEQTQRPEGSGKNPGGKIVRGRCEIRVASLATLKHRITDPSTVEQRQAVMVQEP